MVRVRKAAVRAALVGAVVVGVATPLGLGQAQAAPPADTGFSQPFAGRERWLPFAPTKATKNRQVNEPLGRARADALAASLRFDQAQVLPHDKYLLFMSGQGIGGGGPAARKSAQLIEQSVRYLTNTNATRMYRSINGKKTRVILGGYGLIVNGKGMLESPANASSPVRQVNWVLSPMPLCRKQQPPPDLHLPEGTCGYMVRWMRKNSPSTLEALNASAYTSELAYGSASQGSTEPHETVPNTSKGKTVYVGMPFAPAIYIVNFLLIYALNPQKAANMPAYWAPIPGAAARAIRDSPNGQVPYARYQRLFDNA